MSTTLIASATLTPSQLKEILAGGKTREYKPTIINFVKSNELYLDCMTLPSFEGRKIDSVHNSFNNNLKELRGDNPDWPTIEVKKSGNQVLLINMTRLAGEMEASDKIEDDNEQ